MESVELNHTNLTVTDVDAAADFFERYFELERRGSNPAITILTDESDFVLTLMKGNEEMPVTYPSTHHVGFLVDQDATVDDLHQQLEADGFDVTDVKMRHGSYDFYVEAPSGITVEVGTTQRSR